MAVINEISKSFNDKAPSYERFAKVQLEIGMRMLQRMSYLKIQPRRILDLGCGPGTFLPYLRERFPDAEVVGLDVAIAMLQLAKTKHADNLLAADMNKLPFASGVFDLVFANQALHWADSLPHVFREINRVMNIDGCLMFTTLGPDTFMELKQSWAAVHAFSHANDFFDMHDVGDSLMVEHFVDPVMDMEHLTVQYGALQEIMRSLKAQGVRNIHANRNPGLTGKSAWVQFEQQYEAFKTDQDKYPLTYEVVYGHAWKGAQRRTDDVIETWVPVSRLTRSSV